MSPTPPRLLIVGAPHSASDAAVARFLERFLATEQRGTAWQAQQPAERERAA